MTLASLASADAETPAERRLGSAFREHSQGAFSAVLGDAVCAYVAARKADGCLVEDVIIGMKRIAQRACADSNGYTYVSEGPLCEQNQTMQQAVTLCVCQYFGMQALTD